MVFLPPLAHGVFGIWDEVIPIALFILIGVVAGISGVLSRRRDENLLNPPDKEQQPEPTKAAESKPDHYRLD